MTATRINRKRSHDDLEDGDECLPISKRINSLHIEGQVQVLGQQQMPIANQINPFNGYSDNVAASSLALNHGQGHGGIPTMLQSVSEHEHGTASGAAFDIRHSSLTCHPGLPQAISQIGNSEHPMYLGQNRTSSNSEPFLQFGLYQQTVSGNHFHQPPEALQMPDSFASSSHLSHLSQGDMDIPNHHHISPGAMNVVDTVSASSKECDQFEKQQVPVGPYEPELGVSENPHYFSANRVLYEAHMSRVQRTGSF